MTTDSAVMRLWQARYRPHEGSGASRCHLASAKKEVSEKMLRRALLELFGPLVRRLQGHKKPIKPPPRVITAVIVGVRKRPDMVLPDEETMK